MKIFKSTFFWIVVSIAVLGVGFVALLPDPISMDLEKIGQGKRSVVFIYDPNLAVSNQQSIEINRTREVVGESVVFLVAKVGDPNSAGFRERYNARPAELLLFDGNGELTDKKMALVSSTEFLQSISVGD